MEEIIYQTIQSVIREITQMIPQQSDNQQRERETRFQRYPEDSTTFQDTRTPTMLHNRLLEYNTNFREYTRTVQMHLELIQSSARPTEDYRFQDREWNQTMRRRNPTTTPRFYTPVPQPQPPSRHTIPQRTPYRVQPRQIRRPTNRVIFSTVFNDEIHLPTEMEINQSIRTIPFESQNISIQEPRCPITLESFQEGEPIAQLVNCGHVFREPAIRSWFRRNHGCPVCRDDIRHSTLTIPMDVSMNMRNVETSTDESGELNHLFDSISNQITNMMNDDMEYDISMSMIFPSDLLDGI
jgi:hypothetical protein